MEAGKVDALTRGQLLAAIAQAERLYWALVDEMIAAGRGLEVPTETAQKADPLSQRFTAAMTHMRALNAERNRRLAYHGSEHRIKRAAPTGGAA